MRYIINDNHLDWNKLGIDVEDNNLNNIINLNIITDSNIGVRL